MKQYAPPRQPRRVKVEDTKGDRFSCRLYYAGMMELADMRDLGSRAERRAGSTPVTRTSGVSPQTIRHRQWC